MAETAKKVGFAVESAILKVTKIRQRNLLPAARQAAAAPDTGVKILKKSAYYVIRDCASLASKYVTLLAYAYLKDPLKQLKGKFKALNGSLITQTAHMGIIIMMDI